MRHLKRVLVCTLPWLVLINAPASAQEEFEKFLDQSVLIDKDPDYPIDPDWMLWYLNSVNDKTNIAEIANHLNLLKNQLVVQGYKIDPLPELLLRARDRLVQHGIRIDESKIQKLYIELCKTECL